MIGASAHECSALSPMVPFLKTIRLKDLSNHLKENASVSAWGSGLCHNWKIKVTSLFVKPVIALSMQQGLCIAVQRLDFVVDIVTLLSVIKGYKESCLLNSIQRLLVLTTAEICVPSLCPRGPKRTKRKNWCWFVKRTVKPSCMTISSQRTWI